MKIQSPAKPHVPATPFERLNDHFVEWYQQVEDAAVAALDHVLMAVSTPAGGAYTLWRGSVPETVSPVRARFAELRAVAHVPLSIYALELAPDADRAAALRRDIEPVLGLVEAWPHEDPAAAGAREAGLAVLHAGLDHLDAGGTASFDGLVHALRGPVDVLTGHAGRIQAHDCTALLDRWRDELGETDWAGLHAIVGTAPAERGPGTHGVIVSRALGPDAEADGRLVVLVGLQYPELLRHRLGTILANRALAARWFGDAHHLEGDLMTGPVTAALDGQPERD